MGAGAGQVPKAFGFKCVCHGSKGHTHGALSWTRFITSRLSAAFPTCGRVLALPKALLSAKIRWIARVTQVVSAKFSFCLTLHLGVFNKYQHLSPICLTRPLGVRPGHGYFETFSVSLLGSCCESRQKRPGIYQNWRTFYLLTLIKIHSQILNSC